MGVDLSVITCTGDRPEALELCALWMQRQDFEGSVQWIVIDDGAEQGPVPQLAGQGWETIYQRRYHDADPSVLSLARNLLTACPYIKGNHVAIVEDDDWYSPDHLSELMRRLETADVAGSDAQRYYHLPSRSWVQLTNKGSALAQTAFRARWLPWFREAIALALDAGSIGIDRQFWDMMRKHRGKAAGVVCDVYSDAFTTVGIKGMPGRAGLGVGHKPHENRGLGWKEDPELVKLQEWIAEDVRLYEPYAKQTERGADAE